MRALVVAPEPFFSPRGTPLSVYYRTLITAELDVRVDLLTYGQGQDVHIPGVKIHRIPDFKFLGPIPVGPSVVKVWLDLFVIARTIALLLKNRYHYAHAHEESVFFLRFLKPLFRFKLLYDMHSSLPQQLTNFKFTHSRLLIRLFEVLENTCLKRSDVIMPISPSLQAYATSIVPDPQRVILLENSIFEPVRLTEKSRPSEIQDLDLYLAQGKKIICYAGTFENYQGIDLLVQSFAEVRRRRPDVFLLLIGGTFEQVEANRRLVKELSLDADCHFSGVVSRGVVSHCVNKSDVVVSPRTVGTNTPLKVYELLASGVPVVATNIPAHTQVLDENTCFLVEPNPAELAKGILEALDDRQRRERVVANSKALYQARYSRQRYKDTMRRVLEVLR